MDQEINIRPETDADVNAITEVVVETVR